MARNGGACLARARPVPGLPRRRPVVPSADATPACRRRAASIGAAPGARAGGAAWRHRPDPAAGPEPIAILSRPSPDPPPDAACATCGGPGPGAACRAASGGPVATRPRSPAPGHWGARTGEAAACASRPACRILVRVPDPTPPTRPTRPARRETGRALRPAPSAVCALCDPATRSRVAGGVPAYSVQVKLAAVIGSPSPS